MATLTETAYYTRRILLIGGILLVGFLVLKTSFRLATNVWRKFRPPPPPEPTVSFGALPSPVFPESPERELKFKLETIEGQLPELEKIGKVYFMPKKTPTFLAVDQAKSKAGRMGFRGEPEQLSQTLYRWREETTVLTMDILNGNFQIRYPYKEDQSLLVNKNLPDRQQAAQEARRFLSGYGLLGDDLNNGKAEVLYFRFAPPNLIPALSLSEADFVRVNLFRADLDEMEILPPDPKHSLVSFLISGSRETEKRIVEIDYTYFPIEEEIFGTYPLKPVETAWQELQQGKGYIANLGENEGQITIRKVSLAYYDSRASQNYLQLIYIFRGDNEFLAYVPAVDPKWSE